MLFRIFHFIRSSICIVFLIYWKKKQIIHLKYCEYTNKEKEKKWQPVSNILYMHNQQQSIQYRTQHTKIIL